jgi:AraC-like DNA-binding protein
MMRPPRRVVSAGVQSLPAGVNLPRHQHAAGYVTLVLEGAYEQVGYAGRLRVQAGDVLVQPTLDCHADTMLSSGLKLMRLPWRDEVGFGGVWRGLDVDAIRRLGEYDAAAAATMAAELVDGRRPLPPVVAHWADGLAAELVRHPNRRLEAWARSNDVSREAASRAFRVQYGVSPTVFRQEVRARAAFMRIIRSTDNLAQIAVDLGFNDQPHMTRAVRWLTGATPGVWRATMCSAHLAPAHRQLPGGRGDADPAFIG